MSRPAHPARPDARPLGPQPCGPMRFCARLEEFLALDPQRLEARLEAEAEQLFEAESALDELPRARAGSAAERSALQQEHRRRLRRIFVPYGAGVHLTRGRWARPGFLGFAPEPVYSVLIATEAAPSALAACGLRVTARSADVVTALATRHALELLRASGISGRARLARGWCPALSDVSVEAEIAAYQTAGAPTSPPAFGEGMLVGVVDAWFDLHHADFRDSGKTRVVAYWDQLLAPGSHGTAPSALAPAGVTLTGVVFSRADIDDELSAADANPNDAYSIVPCVPEVSAGSVSELHRHGTYVLGAAAGNASSAAQPVPGSRCAGPAEAADLVLVRALTVSGSRCICDEGLILAGVSFCFAQRAPGQPCVVNLSLGDVQGSHDGWNLGEVFLDGLLQEPGCAITVSAGNLTAAGPGSGSGTHAHRGAGTASAPIEFPLNISADLVHPEAVEIWYDGQDAFKFELEYKQSDGSTASQDCPLSAPPLAFSCGSVSSVLAHDVDPLNGDKFVRVQFACTSASPLRPQTLVFRLIPIAVVNGEVHAWVDRNNLGLRSWGSFGDETALTLTLPGTCRQAITVGAHAKLADGQGLLAESGRGTTRDGRIKPDLCAPGLNVLVPAPFHRGTPPAAGTIQYSSQGGTSIAAPIVAGACALLFQRNRLTAMCADLQQILADLAPMPAGVTAPDVGWGWGRLQLGTSAVEAKPDVDVWLRDAVGDLGETPFTGEVFWESPDIELLDAAGAPTAHAVFVPGARFSNRVRVTVRNRGSSTARNIQVFLYWADPATSIPFPSEWRSSGIFRGAPGFVEESNCIVIPELPAGRDSASLPGGSPEFAWRAPLPGSGLAGDDHFCLLARVECAQDPSLVGAGGFVCVPASNNIALHNVHVRSALATALRKHGNAPLWIESAFRIRGDGQRTDLRVWAEGLDGSVELRLPVGLLPWGDPKVLAASGGRRPKTNWAQDPLRALSLTLDPERAQDLTGIRGIERLVLHGGMALLSIPPRGSAVLPGVRLAHGELARALLRARAESMIHERARVRVGQISDGRRTGGVTLELRL